MLTIKFKIIFSIIILLTSYAFFNFYFSSKLFTDDKTSYIYSTGLNKVEDLIDQIKKENEFLMNRTYYTYLLSLSKDVDLEKILLNQPDFLLAGNFLITETDHLNPINEYSSKKNLSLLQLNKVDIYPEFFKNKRIKLAINENFLSTWIVNRWHTTPIAISLYHLKESPTVFYTVIDVSKTFKHITSEKNFDTVIITADDSESIERNKKWYDEIKNFPSRIGTRNINVNGFDKLVSFAKNEHGIIIASMINTKDAFLATKSLTKKSLGFGIIFLLIAIIGAIYFSSAITSPLSILTESSQKITSGTYGETIEINTSDELKILGESFNTMSKEISKLLKNKEEMIEKLADLNKNLEIKVADRTKELKHANDFLSLMVNSLNQGLLVFDKDLKCHPTYTKACIDHFKIDPINKSLGEVLGLVESGDIEKLSEWASITFTEMIPFDSAINLGHREKNYGLNILDSDYKHISLDYYPMRDEENSIKNIVLVSTDKTQETKALYNASKNDEKVSMILKILNNRVQFQSFIEEVSGIFDQFKAAIENNNSELIMMLFHTLNGGFGIYALADLQMLARHAENDTEHIDKVRLNAENIQEKFQLRLVEIDELLGTQFSMKQNIMEIPRTNVLSLKEIVDQSKDIKIKNIFYENFVKVPLIEYFKGYNDLCLTISKKIGKKFNGITFLNPEFKVYPEPLNEFVSVLIHIFRNSMDHGLENESTRTTLGKSPEGNIYISSKYIQAEFGEVLYLEIRDDGAGINPLRIREKLGSLYPGQINEFNTVSDDEIIYHILDPYFSTRDEVSALSGRGVGMSAIKEVVDRLDGIIRIKSTVNVGTAFIFLIPTSSLV